MTLEQHLRGLRYSRRSRGLTHRDMRRGLCFVLAAAGLVFILPLASATLPDSLWITGIYDGGDYDRLIAVSSDLNLSCSRVDESPSSATVSIPSLEATSLITPGYVDIHMRIPPGDYGSASGFATFTVASVLKRGPPASRDKPYRSGPPSASISLPFDRLELTLVELESRPCSPSRSSARPRGDG
jgi:hypothetical protein